MLRRAALLEPLIGLPSLRFLIFPLTPLHFPEFRAPATSPGADIGSGMHSELLEDSHPPTN